MSNGLMKKSNKAKQAIKLHKFVASGGRPQNYKGSKGISAAKGSIKK